MLPPNTDASMAREFFLSWFGDDYPDEFVTVSQMYPRAGRTITRHHHFTVETILSTISEHGIDDLVYGDNRNWNLYMSVGVMDEKPKGRKRKGGKNDVAWVPGVWVDLDVGKTGFFDDEEDCLNLLRQLPEEAWPSIVVATGTGGVHAYWKCEEALTGEEAEELCTRWWVYLSSRTSTKIDKLVNCDRLMKLPGSVRWPKSEGDAPALVRLVYSDRDRFTSKDTLMDLSREAYDVHLAGIESRRKRWRENRTLAICAADEHSTWNTLMLLADLEEEFNETYSWDDILLPLGWAKIDTDAEGRDIWSRPGLTGFDMHKSASTNYQGSHVMTLFSDSEETGLARLQDTGAHLTKYRVYIECVWDGDEAAYIHHYHQQRLQ